MDEFLKRFNFRPEYSLLVGIERECFLANSYNEIVPIASQVLNHLPGSARYGYELSACQLEDRVGPCTLEELKNELLKNEAEIKKVELELDFNRLWHEVGPADMPLDVYSDPVGRYHEITRNMPRTILLAACRVIGTHVHIGMPNHEIALKVYNQVIAYTDELCRLGDGSNGKRLEIYKIVAPDFEPPYYQSWQSFYEQAVNKEFVSDPRRCWHIIRLSVHGTIEFRMFGATADLDKITVWAQKCHYLCQKAMIKS